MDCDTLEQLISEDRLHAPAEPAAPASSRTDDNGMQEFLGEAMEALENLDRHRMHRILSDASVEMSGPGFRHDLIVPLLATIGKRWQEGSLRIVHEHLASTIVRSFLAAPRNHTDRTRAPRMIVTTPTGQYHELGALMASAVAEEMGWDVFYLGASLPSEEIAAAVRQTGARAVALSLCYRESDSLVLEELIRLRSLLDRDVPVFVGGNAVSALRDRMVEAGIVCPVDLTEFRSSLQTALSA